MVEFIRNICVSIVNLFFLIWSHSPIFPFTDDRNFPNYTVRKNNVDNKFRISLLSIYLGEICIYVITYSFSNHKFDFVKTFKISEFDEYNLDGDTEKKIEKEYKAHVDNLKRSDIILEKEELLRRLEDENRRIETSNFKFNFYTAIITVLFPVISLFEMKINFLDNIYINSIKILLLYVVINLYCIFIQNIKVRSVNRGCFNDIKLSHNKLREIAFQIYYDWQQKKRKADLTVTFICQIYDWIMIAICLGLAIFCFSFIDKKIPSHMNISKVYTVDEKRCFDNYTLDSITLYNILLSLQEQKTKHVLVLYNKTIDPDIYAIFDKYNKQKVEYVNDEYLLDNEIKIILED